MPQNTGQGSPGQEFPSVHDGLPPPAVGPYRYPGRMAGWDEVTTFEQLQAMTPQERGEHFRASIVLDPSTLSPDARRSFARLTETLNERAAAREERLRGTAS